MDEDLIRKLHGRQVAHGVVLKALIGSVMPDPEMRTSIADAIRDGLERAYASNDINNYSHETLQHALHEVDSLLGR